MRSNAAFDAEGDARRAAAGEATRLAARTTIEVDGARRPGTTRRARAERTTGPRNDRDFILDYRLGGERIAAGLMLYPRPSEENFFLAMVEPPKAIAGRCRSTRATTSSWSTSRARCTATRSNTAKALLRHLIGGLRASDTFNVMLFSGSNRMLAPASVPATHANIERALQTIDEMGGGGSTEIVPALRRIAALPKAPDVSRSVIVVTDGYVTRRERGVPAGAPATWTRPTCSRSASARR